MEIEDGPEDVILFGCKTCKFQMHRRRRIVESHIIKYGAKDTDKYRRWFQARSEGQEHASLDITPDVRAASVHHRQA